MTHILTDQTGSSVPSGDDGYAPRSATHKRLLRIVAAQAAVLSAAVHLLWAWPRVSAPDDPRIYVLIFGALVTMFVAAATLTADEYRRLYALGASILAAFLIGYAAWHGTSVVDALAADPLAIVGKTAECIGFLAFIALFRVAPPTSVVIDRRRQRNRSATSSRNLDANTPMQSSDVTSDSADEEHGDGDAVARDVESAPDRSMEDE